MTLKTHSGSYAIHILDPKLIAESLEGLADELRPIIIDNLSWHAKAVDHVILMNLITSDDFTSLKGIASVHLEK